MSIESRRIIDEGSSQETSTVQSYQRNTSFGSTVQHTSSIVINLRQLQTELQDQHQHEKDQLNGLNQRFQIFIDRIQSLQSQNAKYLAAIVELRRQFSGVNTTEVEETFFSSRSSYSAAYSARIDYDWDLELYQLQISIYQRLIELEQQAKSNRISILEEELKQLVATLMNLRTSYDQQLRAMDNLYAEHGNLVQQYLALTHDWSNIKKQRRKWDLNMEMLKSYIAFYKSLRSKVVVESQSLLISTEEMNQFWILELNRIVKRLRRDFEVFYGAIYEQMTVYYSTKTEEMETNIKQAVQYEQVEYERITMVQQKLQIEYEKVQTTLSYERDVLIRLESTYKKLEVEFQSLQIQNQERVEVQSNELQVIQESIAGLAYDVEEIQRSKASLEVELIIYRQLLEAAGIETPVTMITRPQQPIVAKERTGKLVLERLRKGPIGINECAADGTYISLLNFSSNKTIEISGWSLTRNIDRGSKFRYVIPDGVRLEPGKELRIYARTSGGSGDTNRKVPYQKLINNNLVSWGDGNVIDTLLYNQNGDEEASYSQSLAVQRL